MTIPLLILAAITLVAGFIPFGHFVSSNGQPYTIHLNWTVALVSVIIGVCAILLATWLYKNENTKPQKLATTFKSLYTGAYHRFYIDEVYMFITKKIIFRYISTPIAWFDRHIVDGTMNMFASVSQSVSYRIKGLQSGQVQFYVWVFIIGTLLITTWVLFF